jgi:hypothetical protein
LNGLVIHWLRALVRLQIDLGPFTSLASADHFTFCLLLRLQIDLSPYPNVVAYMQR